jgi:hypothetical protein
MADKSPSDEEHPGFRPRRSGRISVPGEALSLDPKTPGGARIKVHNVSSAGFMAECAEPVLIGSWFTLDVPGIGPVQAQVRWQIGTRMGGMFLDPISLASCEWTAD